jgi:hypothetical protein
MDAAMLTPSAPPIPNGPSAHPGPGREHLEAGGGAKWGKRLGWVAFTFFLIKGLAWLLVPATLAVLASR